MTRSVVVIYARFYMNQLCMISVLQHIKFKEIKIIVVFLGHNLKWLVGHRKSTKVAPELIGRAARGLEKACLAGKDHSTN